MREKEREREKTQARKKRDAVERERAAAFFKGMETPPLVSVAAAPNLVDEETFPPLSPTTNKAQRRADLDINERREDLDIIEGVEKRMGLGLSLIGGGPRPEEGLGLSLTGGGTASEEVAESAVMKRVAGDEFSAEGSKQGGDAGTGELAGDGDGRGNTKGCRGC